MTQVSYGSGFLKKDFVCVEVAVVYKQTSPWTPSGSGVQGIFTNTIGETIAMTLTPSAGGTITPAGFNFSLGGASTNYNIVATFNKKYSGSITFSGTSIDNSVAGGVDKFCNGSIGNFDVLSSEMEMVGNCAQAIFGTNPASVKTFGYSEVDELTTFNFAFQRSNIGSGVTLTVLLVEKALKTWKKDNNLTPPSYIDPDTNISYTTLPTGVFEVQCKENTEAVSYTKELCYKVGSGISFDYSANPAEPWDAYNGIRPRTDGIPFLPFSVGGFVFNEFDPTGKYLYTVSGATFITHTYVNFAQTGFTSVAINFTGFPAAAGMTAVGLAVHPTTGIIYVTYIDGSRKIWLATLTTGGLLQLVGDTTFVSVATVPTDNHDITFTASGQLLLAHGSNLYLVDHNTGLLNSGTPVVLIGATNNTFSIRGISRYANGDLHLAGQDLGLGPIVLLYDGETYTKIRHWASSNSPTPPDSTLSTAYPLNPEVRFNRLFVKNLESNQQTPYDTDLVTGLPITIPQNATVKDCAGTVSKITSWTDDQCYVIDKLPISQGFVEIVGGQIVSNGTCNPIGGFVPPAAVTYSSMSNSITGNSIYALRAATNQVDVYAWNTVTNPGVPVTIALAGVVGTPKSIRTRWIDDSIWLLTEETIGIFRNYRFYTVNIATGATTLMGVANYPAGANKNGHFSWGLDDNMYFSYAIGVSSYRISTLSKTNFYIQEFVADVNYVIDNINTDVTANRLIISKSAVAGLDFMSYAGLIVGTCAGGAIYADAMPAPLTNVALGDSIHKVKKVFIKDLVTGDVTSYYHNPITGEDMILPANARLISCDRRIESPDASVPRFRLYTGIVTWSRLIDNNAAKSITIIRVAGNILINDGFNASNVNAAMTVTYTAEQLAGNLTVAGTAAGSSFIISSI
jgi:hypothetical protein